VRCARGRGSESQPKVVQTQSKLQPIPFQRRRAEDAREELILVTKPWTPPSSLRHPGVPPELPARQRIHGLLERIIVEEAGYDRIPLDEVIRDLADKSRQLDPEERGINFLVFSPESRAEGSTRDLNEARVRISPPLRQVRLVDVLEAVVKTAEVPLQYAVADYGIIFSEQKADRDLFITRSYKVGAGFLGHLNVERHRTLNIEHRTLNIER
jgi:hypothetical protein